MLIGGMVVDIVGNGSLVSTLEQTLFSVRRDRLGCEIEHVSNTIDSRDDDIRRGFGERWG